MSSINTARTIKHLRAKKTEERKGIVLKGRNEKVNASLSSLVLGSVPSCKLQDWSLSSPENRQRAVRGTEQRFCIHHVRDLYFRVTLWRANFFGNKSLLIIQLEYCVWLLYNKFLLLFLKSLYVHRLCPWDFAFQHFGL